MELASAATAKKTVVAGFFSQFTNLCKCMSVVNFFQALNLKISNVHGDHSECKFKYFLVFFFWEKSNRCSQKKPHHFYLQATETGYYITRPLLAAHSHRPPLQYLISPGGGEALFYASKTKISREERLSFFGELESQRCQIRIFFFSMLENILRPA